MLKRRIGTLFLIACIVFASIPITLGGASASQVVYVAGDGSGDFNCDGKADQVEINAALKLVAENPSYTTVHLKGPFTYTITDSIYIGSNTILEGDSNAVVRLVDNAGWPSGQALIKQIEPNKSNKGTIIIRGFEIDGNHDNQPGIVRGAGYYNHIDIWYDNIEVYDMYMHDGHGDGLWVVYSESVKFHDNRIYLLGHDGLFAIKSENVEAYNNRITCRTNSGLRAWNTNHVKFHDNIIDGISGTGGPGIQIQKGLTDISYPMNDIEIYNNIIYTTLGPGIWSYCSGGPYPEDHATNVRIHHNIFYNTGTNPKREWVGGIVTSGFYETVIENNVFDGVYHAAIAQMYAEGTSSTDIPDTGYTTIVRNNIIANTKERIYLPDGTGNGVVNYLPETHSFILENNCFFNNVGGDYKNVEPSSSDIHADPLFADQNNHDYHLKSLAGRWDGEQWVKDSVSSPCIDAGHPDSDYLNEPEDNGDRINIGRYGNTIYSSLSAGSLPAKSTLVSDNRLREASPDTVFADQNYLDVGERPGVGSYRDVIWFDLSEYEGTDNIDKVTLSLFWYYPDDRVRNQDTILEVYRPEKWDTNSVTWNNKDASTPWKNPGGDWFDKEGQAQGSVPYATITIDGSKVPDNQYYEFDVTELVKEYLSGEYGNTGFFIKARTESDNYIAFYSSDWENEDQKPKLVVTKKATLTSPVDNRLREASPDKVFTDKNYLDLGGRPGVGRYRDIIRFNLSEYEGTESIEKATLSLFWYYPEDKLRSQDTILEVYRPEKWDTNSVTWNNKDASTPWKNPGGDWFDMNGQAQGSVPYAAITIDGNKVPDYRYYELDVTELMQKYLSGEYENTGFLLKASMENDNYIAFYSGEWEDENQRPKLEVVYI